MYAQRQPGDIALQLDILQRRGEQLRPVFAVQKLIEHRPGIVLRRAIGQRRGSGLGGGNDIDFRQRHDHPVTQRQRLSGGGQLFERRLAFRTAHDAETFNGRRLLATEVGGRQRQRAQFAGQRFHFPQAGQANRLQLQRVVLRGVAGEHETLERRQIAARNHLAILCRVDQQIEHFQPRFLRPGLGVDRLLVKKRQVVGVAFVAHHAGNHADALCRQLAALH